MFTSKNPNFKKIYVKVNARITKAVPTLNAYKKTTEFSSKTSGRHTNN